MLPTFPKPAPCAALPISGWHPHPPRGPGHTPWGDLRLHSFHPIPDLVPPPIPPSLPSEDTHGPSHAGVSSPAHLTGARCTPHLAAGGILAQVCQSLQWPTKCNCEICKNFAGRLVKHWWLEISRGGRIYTMGIGKHYKLELLPLQRVGLPAHHCTDTYYFK